MLEHQPPAVDRLVILAPTPIGVELFVFAAAAALLDVEMVAFIVGIDGAASTVAPDDGQASAVGLVMKRHGFDSSSSKFDLLDD